MPLGVTAVMLPELDFQQQIELCRKARVSHYSWRPRIIPPDQRDKPPSPWGRHEFDLTPKRLLEQATELRSRLEDAGLTSFGTLPSASVQQTDDELKIHFEGAAAVAAGRVRVGPLTYPAGSFDYGELLHKTIERYGQVVDIARRFGQKIVIETHCRSQATSPALALNICEAFDPSALGVIFDINNFMIEGGLQPNLAVAVLNKYIDHCHVGAARRTDGERDAMGFRTDAFEMCSLPDGDMHMPTWVRALHDAGLRVPLIIENFATHAPSAQCLAESADQLRHIQITVRDAATVADTGNQV